MRNQLNSIELLTSEVESLRNELIEIKKSRSWQIAQMFWQFRANLIPVGSSRERFIKKLLLLHRKRKTPGILSDGYSNIQGNKLEAVNTGTAGNKTEQLAEVYNTKLFDKAWSINKAEIDLTAARIQEVCRAYGMPEELIVTWTAHRFRVHLTLDWLSRYLSPNQASGWIGVEMGGTSILTQFLVKKFPWVKWDSTSGDLRETWSQSDGTVDFIVSTEVVEHLSELPIGVQDTFSHSGLIATIRQAWRVLKPGGLLFITTPNAASVTTLEKLIKGEAPWIYNLHIHEYTAEELIPDLVNNGFTVVDFETVHCMTIDYRWDYRDIFKVLLENNGKLENRGDELFIIVRKNC